MKVLQLCAEKTWRGGEQQLAYLVEGLSRHGVETLIACEPDSPFESYCRKNGFDFIPISFRKLSGLQAAVRLKRICAHHDIHLMHAHSSRAHSAAIFSASLGNRTPVVLSRKVIFPVKNNPISRWKYRHPAIARIIGVSEAVCAEVRPFSSSSDIVHVIHDGIDLTRFDLAGDRGDFRQAHALPPKIKAIGTVAALTEDKDLFTLLRTADRLRKDHPKAHFYLAGEGPLRENLEKEIKIRGLSDTVTLLGFITDIPAFLRDLDIFLMTSKSEGLGSSIIDAFASHLPVVATDAGGIGELVKHNTTGLLATIGDETTLANHLASLLTTPDLRRELTENALHSLHQNFTKTIMVEKTAAIYQLVHPHHEQNS